MNKYIDYEKLDIENGFLDYCYDNGLDVKPEGLIYRLINDEWKLIPNVSNSSDGYNRVRIKGKEYKRQRIIMACYGGLDIKYNGNNMVDHIDRNKLNNHINNLRIVNRSENLKNTNSKCYCFHKQYNKYQVQLYINGKRKYFGLYETEEEARDIAIELKIEHYKTYNHI